MHEREVRIIQDYSKSSCFDLPKGSPVEYLKEHGYTIWAVEEILRAIYIYPFADPESLVMGFAVQMEYFYCLSDSPEQQEMFKMARETAEDILSLIK